MIDEHGNAFTIGANHYGQLGLGSEIFVETPTLLDDLHGRVKEIKTNGEINFAMTNQNEMYFWDYSKNSNISRPIKMFLDKKIIIKTVSCGKNFCVILTKTGILYSFGKSNKFGELGTSDFDMRQSPTPIRSLLEDKKKIDQVQCGYKHCVAIDSLGYVFTWGNVIKFVIFLFFILNRILMENVELEFKKIREFIRLNRLILMKFLKLRRKLFKLQ
jgi:alpha-tubulin suppressor-like RCC1 family protein